MTPIDILTSTAAPLPLPNIDTDQIIPKQFLKRIERTGYGDFLFFDWRRIQEGPNSGAENPDFFLNRPEYRDGQAQILIAERNFGCGSSREHAAWAINQFGFRAVIAPTFADIFYSNAGKNGIILARLTEEETQTLLKRASEWPAKFDASGLDEDDPDWLEKGKQPYKITINLTDQTVTDPVGFHAHFDIDPFRKYCLLNGLDDIGLTLRHTADLDRYEHHHNTEFWLTPKAGTSA